MQWHNNKFVLLYVIRAKSASSRHLFNWLFFMIFIISICFWRWDRVPSKVYKDWNILLSPGKRKEKLPRTAGNLQSAKWLLGKGWFPSKSFSRQGVPETYVTQVLLLPDASKCYIRLALHSWYETEWHHDFPMFDCPSKLLADLLSHQPMACYAQVGFNKIIYP